MRTVTYYKGQRISINEFLTVRRQDVPASLFELPTDFKPALFASPAGPGGSYELPAPARTTMRIESQLQPGEEILYRAYVTRADPGARSRCWGFVALTARRFSGSFPVMPGRADRPRGGRDRGLLSTPGRISSAAPTTTC